MNHSRDILAKGFFVLLVFLSAGFSPRAEAEVGVLHCINQMQGTGIFIRGGETDDEIAFYCTKDGSKNLAMLPADYKIRLRGLGAGLDVNSTLGATKIPYFGFGSPEGDFYGPEIVVTPGIGVQFGILSNGKMLLLPGGINVGLGASATISQFRIEKIENPNLANADPRSSDLSLTENAAKSQRREESAMHANESDARSSSAQNLYSGED